MLAIDNEIGIEVHLSTGRWRVGEHVPWPGRADGENISRATWSGSALTITTRSGEGSASIQGFLKLTMNSDGSIRAEGGPGDGDDVRMVSVYKRFP